MNTEFKTDKRKIRKSQIIGIPSGEYFEITPFQFEKINNDNLLIYNQYFAYFTFNDIDLPRVLRHTEDKLKNQIKNFLHTNHIFDYEIYDDYTVDVFQNVKIEKKIDKIPIEFNFVDGNFDISDCAIVSLTGCPKIINGNFIAHTNDFKNLRGGPSKVNGNYDVRQCFLETLVGSPIIISGDFMAGYNTIHDLEYGPINVKGSYMVDNCLLIDLFGCQTVINKNFDCSYNFLKDLSGGPIKIIGEYNCSYNKILDFKHGPKQVGSMNYEGNKIESFDQFPSII
jgi:hypothetical protein